MKRAVDRIKVDEAERVRTDIGNLKSLEESIGEVGLLNPLIIDENDHLVAGYRRLQACKNLGIQEVEVTIVDMDGDPLKKLDVEVAENFFRKDFTPEEILASEAKRREIVESRRKKGIFERLWLWIKSLFAGSSRDERASEKKKTEEGGEKKAAPPAEPQGKEEDKSEEQDREPEGKEEEKTEEQDRDREPETAEQKDKKSQNVQSKGSAGTAPRQYREVDRDRSIKWRTS